MNWGTPPWNIDFTPEQRPLPLETDFAVIGGGFTGLAAAAWLRRIEPERTVVLLEASRLGSGASGRTGGLAVGVSESDLAGVGDVLGGYRQALAEFGVDAGLDLRGVFEIGRSNGQAASPIAWKDTGTVRVVGDVSGGTIDPGKAVSGLGRVACGLGVSVRENTRVEALEFGSQIVVRVAGGERLRARRALLATNAQSADLGELEDKSWARFTLAVLTEPLALADRSALGLDSGKAFYTVDLPYLWGRPVANDSWMFGAGLVDIPTDRDLAELDIARGDAARQFASLERRVRGLHPALSSVRFTHRWGGPIRFGNDWQLIFDRHPQSSDLLVLNGFGGDGVAMSVYLGVWAAEALADRCQLPPWGKMKGRE